MPSQPQSDSDRVYRTLQEEILRGQWSPGENLRENVLSARYGVSRTPVREALLRLLHDGILDRRGAGIIVRTFSVDDILEIYELRVLLESEAAAGAAKARTEGEVVRLRSLIARDRQLVNPSGDERLAANLEFHRALWAASHNRVLTDLLERLTGYLAHEPQSTLSVGSRWEESLDEHDALVAAIADRDEKTAREIAGAHLTEARRIRVAMFEQSHPEQMAGPGDHSA